MSAPINLRTLALAATNAMLNRDTVSWSHHASEARPEYWPLPIKREPAGPDGLVTQKYRPIALLEYVEDRLAAKDAAERQRSRTIAQGGEEGGAA
jgi:hypothetical protein